VEEHQHFSPKKFRRSTVFCYATKAKDYEFSFEGHPNNTARALTKLYDLGFRRVSFGVQDPEKCKRQYTASPFTMWLK
jgi:oxygen-independent coproporphyrinogen-3 oxidase